MFTRLTIGAQSIIPRVPALRSQVLEGDEEGQGLADLELLLEFLEAETTSNLNFEFLQASARAMHFCHFVGRLGPFTLATACAAPLALLCHVPQRAPCRPGLPTHARAHHSAARDGESSGRRA